MEYQLKVCGLTKLNQINDLIKLKVDFLGFIFYEKSPRYVLNYLSLEQISKINHQKKVGVFVNENLGKIIEISEQTKLNFIQLHGDEPEDFISELRQKLNLEIGIVKVIRIGNQSSDELQKTINQQPTTINYILFDTDSKAFGGTGKTFDWNVLNEIQIPIPYFLSGGISLENIHQLTTINQQPIALDINSKFEVEAGNKDLVKIKHFREMLELEELYIIKSADELTDFEVQNILELWQIEEWKSLEINVFVDKFSASEFHLLVDKHDQILSLIRLNFDFNLKIKSEIINFPEVVGFVASIKGNGYGSRLLINFQDNITQRKLDVIGFCSKDLRAFYTKNKIEILENKAKLILENYDNQWISSEDDDILIFNLSEQKKKLLTELDKENPAYFIN